MPRPPRSTQSGSSAASDVYKRQVVVRAGEVVPVPFEVGVLVSAAGEVEAGPAFDFVGVRDFLVPVLLVHFLGHEFFRIVRSGLVVHDGVQVDAHMVFMKGLDGVLEFLLCLLYTSDAADDLLCVDLGGRRII